MIQVETFGAPLYFTLTTSNPQSYPVFGRLVNTVLLFTKAEADKNNCVFVMGWVEVEVGGSIHFFPRPIPVITVFYCIVGQENKRRDFFMYILFIFIFTSKIYAQTRPNYSATVYNLLLPGRSLLYSAILNSPTESLRSCRMAVISRFAISIEVLYSQRCLFVTWLVPRHNTAAVSVHVLCTPYNHAPVYGATSCKATRVERVCV